MRGSSIGQRLYKRAGSPNYYVFLGRDAAGKKVYRSTGCRDKRAAEAMARELERTHRDPHHAPARQTTLGKALGDAYEDREARGRAAGTLHMYDIKSGHLNRILGASTPLDDITASEVDRYVTTRLGEDGNRDTVHRNTITKELGVLRVALKLARRRGEYDADPASVLPVGWSSEYVPVERSLTKAEAARLIADLEDDTVPQRRRSMRTRAAQVAFIIATSARISESIRAQRVDVRVVGSSGFVALRGSKTKTSTRTVPVLPATAPLVRLALKYGAKQGALFPRWQNVRRDLHEACDRLGIPPCSPNDLRRTTAQWLTDAGVEPYLVAAVLGHKDTRMVERVYGRITPDALSKAIHARVGADGKARKRADFTGTSRAPKKRKKPVKRRQKRRD